ncbi:trigger factor [Aliarcobacter skirrowii]|uniref:Trigger factor n=1 Tax=Aliarcobacter skirrowii TaxID=28200 RepID=A0A2U2BZC0_9BACT|nr:trigger factor [Aliarcobacter skirrowii]MDX4036126.1 trigger factor [Aliarcobacter skirrowii]PWE20118.1 trigger factor [Aliarcobacter skirrowii]PWE20217.1 trigger factor [Aliarcobacter skirrowii]PWE25101.1 trigger factor [Aliarcobacter skirrowii]RJO55565.1 trigger factor [Aliarcobacter skirrowii]
MEFKTNRVDEANIEIVATLKKENIEKKLDKVATQAAKTMNIQGFRKGKVPVAVVKQRYADKLLEDAEGEAIRDVLNSGLKELNVKNEDLIGEPSITKFDKKDNGDIEVEISVATKPNIDLGDYKKLLPDVKAIEIDAKKIDERIEEIASQSAPLTKIARKRAVKDGDFAVIDFEGFVDGVAFEGGKAEKYPLQVGTGSFIPGFEDQVIGMKYEEEKDVVVTFPKEYQAKDLAGKEAVFKVKLHEIQERKAGEITDEFAKQMLPNEKDATVDTLRDRIKEQMVAGEKATYYREDLKPKFIENLVKNINFALPKTVVEQEINFALNNKIRSFTEEQINELKEDASKIEKIREELKEDAVNSVKATFIVDALAKAEKVEVNDQEVTQILYFEALQMGQNPQELIKQYQQAGYLPAIKMSMIEEKVLAKLFDEKAK